MTTFHPVNTALAPDMYRRNGEETTPTTPRPSTAPNTQPQPSNRMDDATTPTRATFGALASQRPLPAQPFPAAVSMPEAPSNDGLHRGDSQYSSRSNKSRDSDDVDMDGSEDGEEGSDEESINADGTRTKKKKSQRFYCTDYPPCNLSFTRSEHLARHIRKHTGERPFQCHCSRRFSRLDNLRQHAQTVHVNEEIPTDSLAATGTRFQRQVRTDRVRPPGNRSRASTAGSQTGGRGHQRNSLSASSITSVGSFTQRDDARRRPPPLQMAGAQRLSGEVVYRPGSPTPYLRSHSPGGFSTPTSATFSTGQNSPRWGSGMQSPISSHSRTQSIYDGHRTPGRRLSVPSAGNPFQSPQGGYGPPPLGGMNSSMPFSASSGLTSPTTPSSGSFSRRESVSSASDEAWRRRTWHPETYSNFTSRLQNVSTNYYSNGPPPQVPVVPSNAPPLNSMRLPGIESFDPLPRPQTPVRRQPSPMNIDTPTRAPIPPVEAYREERPNSQHWDMNRNLTRLDLGHSDAAGSWASDANRTVQAQAEHPRTQPPPPPQTVRFEESPYSARSQQNAYQHQSAPPITPKENKRHGWYHGPVTPVTAQPPPIDPRLQRTSPEDSSSSEGVPGTPSSASVAQFDPSIMHSNGYVENRNGIAPVPESSILRSNAPNGYVAYAHPPNGEAAYTYNHGRQPSQQSQPLQHQVPKGATTNMSPLDTLVAAATSQENTAAY